MAINNIIQLGLVCRAEDLEDTIRYWQESAGAGPCWVIDAHPDKQMWYGEPTDGKLRTGYAYVGDLQLEIISPASDSPNPVTAALAETRNPPRAGIVHHFQLEAQDYDATVADLLAGGSTVAWTSEFRGRQISFLESKETFGLPYLEVAGPRGPESLAMAEAMKRYTRAWDGTTDPVRSYVALLEEVTAA